jgi:uncharacterized membrane protein YbhN (UPF0104 family)
MALVDRADNHDPATKVAASSPPEQAPTRTGVKRKLIRGGIVLAVLVAVVIGVVGLLPGLSGVRAAIGSASVGWVLAAAGIQMIGTVGAVVFVQLVFSGEPHRLTWKMGGAMQAVNAVLPTGGGTLVSYWTLSSVGWGGERFAERTAVMIIASAAPNLLAAIVVGLGMGLGLFAGPDDWWLTFLPAAIALLVAVVAIWAAGWGHRLAARAKHRWLREGLHVVATGVSGTVEILRHYNWRVLGTWVDLLGWIGALWAALYAVGEHLPFAVVAMAYLIGQIAQVIPVPGGIGAIDAGVTGALVLYGADASKATAGELIAHAVGLLVPIAVGAVPLALLPKAIEKRRARLKQSSERAVASGERP